MSGAVQCICQKKQFLHRTSRKNKPDCLVYRQGRTFCLLIMLRPCRRAGQSGVVRRNFTFHFHLRRTTPDTVWRSPAFSNCFCPNLSGATEYRSHRNNLLKYRPIPPLTGGNFLFLSYGL